MQACYDRRKRKKMSCELVSSRHYDFENLASVTEDLWFSCTARELGHHEVSSATSSFPEYNGFEAGRLSHFSALAECL
jgi:hypothetical protein